VSVGKDGKPPPESPFGDCRMHVRAEKMLRAREHNLYFADFYCNQHDNEQLDVQRNHYVTIVICDRNSEADR